MGFVIRYDSEKHPGYYSGNDVRLPAMGATIDKTPKYATADQARGVMRQFPFMASMSCDVVTEDLAKELDAEHAAKQKKQPTRKKT